MAKHREDAEAAMKSVCLPEAVRNLVNDHRFSDILAFLDDSDRPFPNEDPGT